MATLVVSPVLLAAAVANSRGPDPQPGEMGVFGPAGRALLEGRWSDVFADDAVQAGPLELLPYGLAEVLALRSSAAWAAFYLVTGLLMTLAVVHCLQRLDPRWSARTSLLPLVAVAAAVTGSGLVMDAVYVGHPSQVLVPLMWLVAGEASRRGSPVLAGSLVGLSAGWEVWGLLGAACLLCGPRRQLVASGAAAVTAAALLFAPFVATGSFGTGDKAWPVASPSLVHLVLPDVTSFSWQLRLGQAVVAVLVGAAVALACRGSVHGPWAAVLAVLGTRLLLDPLLLSYYWLAPLTVALVAAARCLHGPASPVLAGATLVLLVALLVGPYGGWQPAAALLAWLAVAVPAVRRTAQDTSRVAPAPVVAAGR